MTHSQHSSTSKTQYHYSRNDSGYTAPACDERNQSKHEKDKKQNLGDTRSRSGDATETKHGSDERNHKKDN
jgi:hypothetical protein